MFSLHIDTRNPSAPKVKRKVPRNHVYLKWTALCISFVAVVGAIVYFCQTGRDSVVPSSKHEHTNKPVTSSDKKTATRKARKAKKPDPFASITNQFDKTISKELNKGQKFLDRGQIQDALKKFEDLVHRYPNSPRARYGQAQSLDKLAEKQRSNELLGKCIEVYEATATLPDCPMQLKRLALLRAASRWSFFGKIQQAVRVLQQLSGYFPDDVGILNELGVQYLIAGRNGEAERVYEKVRACWNYDC